MSQKGNILIVDDNTDILEALSMLLRSRFEEVVGLDSPKRLLSMIKSKPFDVVLLDMNFTSGANSGNEGLFWLKEILNIDPEICVITITAYGDVNLAVKTLKLGATDFLLKPWDNKRLVEDLETAVRLKKSKKKVAQSSPIEKTSTDARNKSIIGSSAAMERVMSLVRKVATTDADVLVTGENGTGKELIAQEIHNLSNRSSEPIVSVDLGSISNSLFESELFGHVKGAFTDAKSDRRGKIEAANKGTLFLDEIGNLNLDSQVKLLSALQNRKISPVGSDQSKAVDIRLICATNAKLQQMVQAGEFREDLLYRINTIEIEIPPLRERKEDISILADHFLHVYQIKYLKNKLEITNQAKEDLKNYSWPGNVRELQHMIEKAVILSEGNTIETKDFSFKKNLCAVSENYPQTLDDMEKAMIIKVVTKHAGNMSSSAGELGVTRQTLYNKIKKYELETELMRDDR